MSVNKITKYGHNRSKLYQFIRVDRSVIAFMTFQKIDLSSSLATSFEIDKPTRTVITKLTIDVNVRSQRLFDKNEV